MNEIRSFVLDKVLAGDIFGIEEETVKKATQHSYKCYRLKRQNSDLIFVTDHSGNIFEIQQTN